MPKPTTSEITEVSRTDLDTATGGADAGAQETVTPKETETPPLPTRAPQPLPTAAPDPAPAANPWTGKAPGRR